MARNGSYCMYSDLFFINISFKNKNFFRDGFRELAPHEIASLTPYGHSNYEIAKAGYELTRTVLSYLMDPNVPELQTYMNRMVSFPLSGKKT